MGFATHMVVWIFVLITSIFHPQLQSLLSLDLVQGASEVFEMCLSVVF